MSVYSEGKFAGRPTDLSASYGRRKIRTLTDAERESLKSAIGSALSNFERGRLRAMREALSGEDEALVNEVLGIRPPAEYGGPELVGFDLGREAQRNDRTASRYAGGAPRPEGAA